MRLYWKHRSMIWRTWRLWPKSLLFTRHGSVRRVSGSSSESGVQSFDQLGETRRTQASKSLLVQVQSVKSAGTLASYLEQYGTLSNIYHFTNGKKEFLFVEMASPEAAEAVLRDSCHSPVDSVVPVMSPLLWLRAIPGQKQQQQPPPDNMQQETERTEQRLVQQLLGCHTLEQQLTVHYEFSRLTELGCRLRYFTCHLLERALSGMFPAARVRPFGSSANGFGRHDCDVDMVLDLASRTGQATDRLAFQTLTSKPDPRLQTQRYLTVVSDLLASFLPGCVGVRRILKARVPIVKYTQSLTGIDCDLSMQRNGLHMTELLYLWSQLDRRVAPLVMAVRRWAAQVHLTHAISGCSGSGRWISNFGVTLLVVFFLQTRPTPLLPSVNDLAQLARPCDWCDVDGSVYSFLRDPAQIPRTDNTEPLSELFVEFFRFYSDLDLEERALSVVWASQVRKPAGDPIYVQNPLDRELNVCKNVSYEEGRRLRAEAARAVRLLLTPGLAGQLLVDGGASGGGRGRRAEPVSLRELFQEEAVGDNAPEVGRPGEFVQVRDHFRSESYIVDVDTAPGTGRDSPVSVGVSDTLRDSLDNTGVSDRARDSPDDTGVNDSGTAASKVQKLDLKRLLSPRADGVRAGVDQTLRTGKPAAPSRDAANIGTVGNGAVLVALTKSGKKRNKKKRRTLVYA